MENKVFNVDSERFSKEYEFLDGYDDYVVNKKTKIVYKSNFVNGIVQLVEVSNLEALGKIEEGFKEFREKLAKEMGFKIPKS
ncbi:hypothetical protein [Nitrosophilus labii]|uniref:hypothetical protein n=1 Tax=Nitrosophilus labii TaxID=2706014 RepID=UPI0016574248|nr:hypothetical protein [Nitrosophilus labii]